MTITVVAIANAFLALAVVSALGAVIKLGFRIDRAADEGSIVPAPRELAEAA
jgi:hypothetical protein